MTKGDSSQLEAFVCAVVVLCRKDTILLIGADQKSTVVLRSTLQ
jgi:hypothetical protein